MYLENKPSGILELDSYWLADKIHNSLQRGGRLDLLPVSYESSLTFAQTPQGTEAFCVVDFLYEDFDFTIEAAEKLAKPRDYLLPILDWIFDFDPATLGLLLDLEIRRLPEEAREALRKHGYRNTRHPDDKHPLPIDPQLLSATRGFRKPYRVTIALYHVLVHDPSTAEAELQWTGYSETEEQYSKYGFLNFHKRDKWLNTDAFLGRLESQFEELDKYRFLNGNWVLADQVDP